MTVGAFYRVFLWFDRQPIALAELIEIELGHGRLEPDNFGFKGLIGRCHAKLFVFLFRSNRDFQQGNRLAQYIAFRAVQLCRQVVQGVVELGGDIQA
jgi:hypothetical protein